MPVGCGRRPVLHSRGPGTLHEAADADVNRTPAPEQHLARRNRPTARLLFFRLLRRARAVPECVSRRRGLRIESLPIDWPSPDGEPLTIDVGVARADSPQWRSYFERVAWRGRTLWLGGAARLLGLAAVRLVCTKRLAVVLIHALNPFGFAWRRASMKRTSI